MSTPSPETIKQSKQEQIQIGRKLRDLVKTEGWEVFSTSIRHWAEVEWELAKTAPNWESFLDHRARAQSFDQIISEIHREIAEADKSAKELDAEEKEEAKAPKN
jgi:hypothetical protein